MGGAFRGRGMGVGFVALLACSYWGVREVGTL